jgi:hypothetical protein
MLFLPSVWRVRRRGADGEVREEESRS